MTQYNMLLLYNFTKLRPLLSSPSVCPALSPPLFRTSPIWLEQSRWPLTRQVGGVSGVVVKSTMLLGCVDNVWYVFVTMQVYLHDIIQLLHFQDQHSPHLPCQFPAHFVDRMVRLFGKTCKGVAHYKQSVYIPCKIYRNQWLKFTDIIMFGWKCQNLHRQYNRNVTADDTSAASILLQ